MEEKKLNFDAPLLSVRRVPSKPQHSSESEDTRKKTKKEVKGLCLETEHETLVRLLLQDQSFDHVMEPSSFPFEWERTPGNPKYHTLIEESDLIKALDMVSPTASFSVNCSTISGERDEFEKNGDGSCNVLKYDVFPEYRDVIMARFLPDAKAMAMKQITKNKKQSIALQRVSMAINQDLNIHAADDDEDDDYDHNHVDGNEETVSKKAVFGLCTKNSLDVLNPVLSRVKTCQNLGVKSVVNPKSLDFVNQTKSSIILRSNKVMSKSQELYPIIPRFSTEISKISLSKPGEIMRIPRNPSRLQRTTSGQIQRQDTRFLAEEVKRRRKMDKIRSRNLYETSSVSVSQPPLPRTPSESWLCRTLPRTRRLLRSSFPVNPPPLSLVKPPVSRRLVKRL